MKQFAKLVETERGQVLAMRENDDDGDPVISICFDAGVDGLDITKIKLGFGEDGHDRADLAFEKMTEEGLVKVAFSNMDKIQAMFAEGAPQ